MAAFYRAKFSDFLAHDPVQIIGALSSAYQHNELQKRQIRAWQKEITILKAGCAEIVSRIAGSETWSLLLEYPIPRRHKRLDAVILARDVVLCLEFKTEDAVHSLQCQRQAEEYALDLRDFHDGSRERRIVPIAVVPKAGRAEDFSENPSTEPVRRVRLSNAADLATIICAAFQREHRPDESPIDAQSWDLAPYRPIPTIIEAAEALYAGHNVVEIARSHAGTTNLTSTSSCLVEAIQCAQREHQKVICFVTGVPGAGKTLAGLNVVHNPVLRREGRPAGVFLSGNGPLVKIVSAAIARDHKRRVEERGGERTVSTFIQNVHTFVREGLDKPDKPPVENVIVFDEAQRAWNSDQNRKKNGVDMSEAEIVLGIMDRHTDWAVLIALIGGGQEIHNGEAGLSEWGKTLRDKFPHWRVIVSSKTLESDASLAGHRLFDDGNAGCLAIKREPALHLEVSLRSFRARRVTEWVEAMLACDPVKASRLLSELRGFPIAMTRSLPTAREWLRNQTRGERRCGLVASSGGLRLRAHGLELSSGFRQGNRDIFVHWFLAQPPDVRSSNQLEVAASEFECQGLELDWIGACWAGDCTFDPETNGWAFRNFSGTRWGMVRTEIDRRYLLNTYRVLLTRARQGLIIWVPEGDDADLTLPRKWFDSTADYLTACGLETI